MKKSFFNSSIMDVISKKMARKASELEIVGGDVRFSGDKEIFLRILKRLLNRTASFALQNYL